MDFHLTDPELILSSSWIDEYKKDIELIWHEIVSLNTILYILKRIRNFPFTLFFPSIPLFWQFIIKSLYESSVLIISKLLFDESQDSLTLLKLKNNIRKNIIYEDYLKDFYKELKKINITEACNNIEGKIKDIRHKKIAHFDKSWNVNLENKSLYDLIPDFEEIINICDKINTLFSLLCFSEQYSVEYIEYDAKIQRPKGQNYKTDIDEILDYIAKESSVLNMPEQQKEFWPQYRENLSNKELEILNLFRVKFNLPKA